MEDIVWPRYHFEQYKASNGICRAQELRRKSDEIIVDKDEEKIIYYGISLMVFTEIICL